MQWSLVTYILNYYRNNLKWDVKAYLKKRGSDSGTSGGGGDPPSQSIMEWIEGELKATLKLQIIDIYSR